MLQKTFQACTVSTVGVGRVVKNINRPDGLIISYTDAGAAGLFISAVVTGPTQSATVACNMYEAVASILAEKSAVLVHERAFASLSRANDLISSRRQVFSSLGVDPDTPYSVIQVHPPGGKVYRDLFFMLFRPVSRGSKRSPSTPRQSVDVGQHRSPIIWYFN